MPPRVVHGQPSGEGRGILSSAPFGRAAGSLAFVAGLIYMIGSLVDFGILWLFQRQDAIQWEFVALVQTAEGFPRLVLGAALVLLGLYARGSLSRWKYRSVGALVLLLGLVAGALGALAVLNYLTIMSAANQDAAELFQSATLKTVVLCGLYVVLLLPVGVLIVRAGGTRASA